MGTIENKEKVWSLIREIKVGMLVTNKSGVIHARPMQLVQNEYDGTIWFFTDLNSEKISETNSNDSVCLTFSCPKDNTYISLTGEASISKDKKIIDELWSPFVSAWFPDGKENSNVGLLEIKINAGEYWLSDSNGIFNAVKILAASFKNEKPDIGVNQKFGNV